MALKAEPCWSDRRLFEQGPTPQSVEARGDFALNDGLARVHLAQILLFPFPCGEGQRNRVWTRARAMPRRALLGRHPHLTSHTKESRDRKWAPRARTKERRWDRALRRVGRDWCDKEHQRLHGPWNAAPRHQAGVTSIIQIPPTSIPSKRDQLRRQLDSCFRIPPGFGGVDRESGKLTSVPCQPCTTGDDTLGSAAQRLVIQLFG